jgi:hypothetical protein
MRTEAKKRSDDVMKPRCFIPPVVLLKLLIFTVVSAYSQTVVTFDDLNETGSGAFFSIQHQGYQGLSWSNILCNNAILETNIAAHIAGGIFGTNGLSGDYYGMVSPSNVAVMVSGCEIDSPGTGFNFLSAYLTGFYNSNLNIDVQGYRDTNLVYDQTVVASATNATLFTFNFSDIDRLYFTSYGGQGAFESYNNGSEFVMDNFEFEFIPEPSSFLLAALGAVSLIAFLRRKRT